MSEVRKPTRQAKLEAKVEDSSVSTYMVSNETLEKLLVDLENQLRELEERAKAGVAASEVEG